MNVNTLFVIYRNDSYSVSVHFPIENIMTLL